MKITLQWKKRPDMCSWFVQLGSWDKSIIVMRSTKVSCSVMVGSILFMVLQKCICLVLYAKRDSYKSVKIIMRGVREIAGESVFNCDLPVGIAQIEINEDCSRNSQVSNYFYTGFYRRHVSCELCACRTTLKSMACHHLLECRKRFSFILFAHFGLLNAPSCFPFCALASSNAKYCGCMLGLCYLLQCFVVNVHSERPSLNDRCCKSVFQNHLQ